MKTNRSRLLEKIAITQTMEEPQAKLKYEPPKIITYTSDELLEQIGPAMACSPSPCPTP